MSEEIKDSPVTTDQSTEVESASTEVNVDWQKRYKEEVKSSKNYRQRAQSAEGKLETRDKETEKQRKLKMEEDGKLKELLVEQDKMIEDLKVKADAGEQLLKDQHNRALEELPEEDREDFVDLPLKQLLKVVNKFKVTEAIRPEIPSVKGAVKNVVSNKPYASMTEAEREQWHNDRVANLKS